MRENPTTYPVRRGITALFLATLISAQFSVHATELAELDPALAELFSALETETTIATKTRMNVDFVPGMVSVLRRDELEDRGVRYLYEALNMIPGIEILSSVEGQHEYVVRGVGKSFSSGKVKMLLNNVPLNSALSAASTLSSIPMENVERIEVIRGPSSSVYGEYAFTGMINIITRKDNILTASYTNENAWRVTGAATKNYGTANRISLTLGLDKVPGGNIDAGEDFFVGLSELPPYLPFQSYSPGKVNDVSANYSATLDWQHRHLRLLAQDSEYQAGDYYGYRGALPDYHEIIRYVHTSNINLEYQRPLGQALDGRVDVGWRRYSLLSGDHLFIPANQPPLGNSEDLTGSPNYFEQALSATGELNYTGIRQHNFLIGGSAGYVAQGETWATRNFIVSGSNITQDPGGLTRHTDDANNWLTTGNRRYTLAGYIQDEFAATDNFRLTAGLRGDYYHNIGQSYNPRVAGVYQLHDHHVLKAQYATAFRPPTFVELYARNNPIVTGNIDIKPETNQVGEVSYIFNNGKQVARALMYAGKMKNLIVNDTIYKNIGSVDTAGSELETTRIISPRLQLDGNISYHWTKDNATGEALPMVSKVLANAGINYRLLRDLNTHLHIAYNGPKEREANDLRSEMRASAVADLTLRYEPAMLRGAAATAGIKNLLDTPVHYPAEMTSLGAFELPTYQNDLPAQGRYFWLRIEYRP